MESEKSEEENKNDQEILTKSVLAEIVQQAKRMKHDKACPQPSFQTS